MTRSERQVEELGVFVHGVLAGLHLIGLVYNLRKRNWADAVAHAAAGSYDTWAATKHAKRVSGGDDV